jgi:NAD(P)-dependent dehydrogenase (short-subunit alcohol dehydrogenase family)
LRAEDVEVEAWQADLLDPAAMPKVVTRAVEAFGSLDVLVNNAADGGPIGPTWEVDHDDWWRTLEINLRGTTLATNAALTVMEGGRIINLVSNAGVHRWPYVTAYSVSKAAVIKLTENLAVELRQRGVAVLGYDPGMVDAGLMRAGFDDVAVLGNPHLERMVSWAREQRAAGRFTPVEQSTGMLVRLALGDADPLSGGLITARDDLDARLAG